MSALIRGLTLTQPWASLVALGHKTIETRSWGTSYRGLVAIHAAKGYPAEARALCTREPFARCLGVETLHTGVIVATAHLETCFRFDDGTAAKLRARSDAGRLPPFEVDFGDYTQGRYGFVFTSVRRLPEPIPARGMLSLWEVPDEIAARVFESAAPQQEQPAE